MQTTPVSQDPAPQQRENRRRLLGIALVLGVLALVCLVAALLTHSPQRSQTGLTLFPTPSATVETAAFKQPLALPHMDTVQLTDSGFSPAKISIHKNSGVKWINNSNTDNASVNSDDYPTNQRFPELNLGKFNIGASLAHIFSTAGTYTYHNQFNPKQTGTIVVE